MAFINFRAFAFKHTQFYRHRGENQLPNGFEVPGAQVDPYQTLKEVARKN